MAEREMIIIIKIVKRVKEIVTGRELRPPDTSTLSSLLTLLNSISPTKLKTLICTSFTSILYTTYSNTTIFSFRLSSSSSTECTLEAEHTTPFSFTFGVIEIICPI